MGLADFSLAPANLCPLQPAWARASTPSILHLISKAQKDLNEPVFLLFVSVFWFFFLEDISPEYLQSLAEDIIAYSSSDSWPGRSPLRPSGRAHTVLRGTGPCRGCWSPPKLKEQQLGPLCATRDGLQTLSTACSTQCWLYHKTSRSSEGFLLLAEV